MNILIVDDDHQIRKFVSRALEDEGYDCETAANGREALTRIDAGKFDVVLLDILMPEADGIQVLNELRTGTARPELHVIAMSGGGEALPGWYAGNLMEMLGAEAVLYKPFSVDELLSKIPGTSLSN